MVLGKKSFEAAALSFWIMMVSHGGEENNWVLCMIFPFLTIWHFDFFFFSSWNSSGWIILLGDGRWINVFWGFRFLRVGEVRWG